MSTPRSFPADRAAAFKASTRQQAAYKALNAANDPARTTFDDVLAAMDRCHLGRIDAKPAEVKQTCTPEEIDQALHADKLDNGYAKRNEARAVELERKYLMGGT